MTELFLHWDLFLIMPAPIWHLDPYILIKDKLVRILEVINSRVSFICKGGLYLFLRLENNQDDIGHPKNQ